MHKLVIIDDEYLAREGLRKTIDWASHGIALVGEATNGAEGYELIQKLKPDIILSDAKMPVLNGLDLAKRLYDEQYDGIIVVLSGYREFEYAKKAVESDVFAYLLKPTPNEELIQTILAAARRLDERRENRKLMSLYQESQEDIKLKIIRDLIRTPKPDIVQFKERIVANHLPFFEDGVVVVGSMDEFDEEFAEDIFVLVQIMRQTFDAQGIAYLDAIYHNRLLWLVNSESEEAYNALDKALQHYEEEIGDFTFSFGISNHFLSLKMVAREYENAKNLADSELFISVNSIMDSKNSKGRYSKNTGRALQIIFNEYDQPLTVKYVATKIDVSESYLAHLLKGELGKTFNEILTNCRIAHAKKLLKEGRYRVGEVAFMVGYNDERYFAAIFKKYVGVQPTKYLNETS